MVSLNFAFTATTGFLTSLNGKIIAKPIWTARKPFLYSVILFFMAAFSQELDIAVFA